MRLNYSRSINGSNFATPDNSESVFPASPAGNYQVGQTCRLKTLNGKEHIQHLTFRMEKVGSSVVPLWPTG